MSEQQKNQSSIPNKAFDMEYSTQTKKEMLYLRERGFEPCFRKKTSDYRIPTYKYKKTPQLFRAVADYYEQVESQKTFTSLKSQLTSGMTREEFISKLDQKTIQQIDKIVSVFTKSEQGDVNE